MDSKFINKVFRDLNSNLGQSVIEYILLLLIIVSAINLVFKSDQFRSFFGNDSQFFRMIATKIQYGYRHGTMEDSQTRESDRYDYNGIHESYCKSPCNGQNSRFFLPLEKYPR
ncbi:MAG: hypothetical protein ACPGJV_07855 [Bacteriovoracaceae bacterium]